LQAREGDLIKTKDNIVFDVKGLVHPPNKVVAFPRFIPSCQGTRGNNKTLYQKIYNLSERFEFLKKNAPGLIVEDPVFGESLCEVPCEAIKKYYKPIEELRKLRNCKTLEGIERKAMQFAEELKKAAKIPWNSIGISGSVMVGLFTVKSDIDPVVYGVENAQKAYSALRNLIANEDSHFRGYSRKELKTLFDFRSKDTMMTYEDFSAVESEKAFQGKFLDVDYFVRFVKDWNEVHETYGDVCYRNCGYAKIKATVSDDSESLFTPCTYGVENIEVAQGPKPSPIREIVSFRGRFCEQAKKGEKVTAQGKIERVTDKRKQQQYFRILIGNKPSDFMTVSC
jgi:predicted nucleotidyltransferase